MPGSALIRLQGCLIDADPSRSSARPWQGSGPRYEQGTLIEIMPKDLLGPTPEKVQLWLRFRAAAQRLVISGVRCAGRPPPGGHGKGDAQPPWPVGRGRDGAVVGRGDLGDDGEPEAGPGTLRRGSRAVEAVEDPGEPVGGDAGAVVADLDDHAVVVVVGGDDGGGPLRGVRVHVGQQVVHGPAQ